MILHAPDQYNDAFAVQGSIGGQRGNSSHAPSWRARQLHSDAKSEAT